MRTSKNIRRALILLHDACMILQGALKSLDGNEDVIAARRCPCCNADSYVAETREYKDGTIHRRRECLQCGARFSTVERFDHIVKRRTDND